MATPAITGADVIRRYADDIAFIAGETPATTLPALVDHITTAASRCDAAGINGQEDLEAAALYVNEAYYSDDDTERSVFLSRADKALWPIVWDMTSEYRTAVA